MSMSFGLVISIIALLPEDGDSRNSLLAMKAVVQLGCSYGILYLRRRLLYHKFTP